MEIKTNYKGDWESVMIKGKNEAFIIGNLGGVDLKDIDE